MNCRANIWAAFKSVQITLLLYTFIKKHNIEFNVDEKVDKLMLQLIGIVGKSMDQ